MASTKIVSFCARNQIKSGQGKNIKEKTNQIAALVTLSLNDLRSHDNFGILGPMTVLTENRYVVLCCVCGIAGPWKIQ